MCKKINNLESFEQYTKTFVCISKNFIYNLRGHTIDQK